MVIRIADTEHPVFFDWLAIEAISESIQERSLDSTVKNINTHANSLRFTRIVAFEGIKCGYKKQGKECPFKTSEELAEKVRGYNELGVIIAEYVSAVSEFYNSEDAEVDNKKKQSL